jgi:NADH-quinone oxidoreductase subunit F
VIADVKESGLRGRGGAGFPTGLKWSFMPRQFPGRSTWSATRTRASRAPARTATSCVQPAHRDRRHGHRRLRDGHQRGLQLHPRRDLRGLRALRGRLEEARAAGYLGDNILGSGFSFQLHAHHGFGAYICGEETALLESLEGKKGQPRFKPPFPASFGLYGKPTTINNTETFAAVPWIIRNGGQAYLECGKPNNGGTKIFSVSATSSVRATTRFRWARRSPSCWNWPAACGRRSSRP